MVEEIETTDDPLAGSLIAIVRSAPFAFVNRPADAELFAVVE